MQNSENVYKKNLEVYALGEMLREHGGVQLALDVTRRGGGKADLMRAVSDQIKMDPVSQAADRLLGFISEKNSRSAYSISRALLAHMDIGKRGAPFEYEISELAHERTGVMPFGFWAPIGLLARDFAVGTANTAGNLITTGVDAIHAMDPLRKVSALARMGVTILTGLHDTPQLPRFVSSTTLGSKTESGTADTLIETTTASILAPTRVSASFTMTKQALLQSSVALDATISQHLLAAVMEQVENAAINGDGTNNTPIGLRATSGIGSVVGGTNGAQISFANLSDMENQPGLVNAREFPESSGYIINSATRRWLRTVPRASNLPFIYENSDTPLLGHRVTVSNLMPGNLTKGTSSGTCSSLVYSSDWSRLIVGFLGGGVDIIVNPITLADSGLLKITATALICIGVSSPEHFSKFDDALTA